RWLDTTLAQLRDDVTAWCRREASAAGIAFDRALSLEDRTLSPSDFGFHNAIRRPGGGLVFLDFEYFGWDDPAKTIADFLLHPAMTLSAALKYRFAAGMIALFDNTASLRARARIVYPLFALKWVTILLNDFLPERFTQATAERRAVQFAKAEALVGRVAAEYR